MEGVGDGLGEAGPADAVGLGLGVPDARATWLSAGNETS